MILVGVVQEYDLLQVAPQLLHRPKDRPRRRVEGHKGLGTIELVGVYQSADWIKSKVARAALHEHLQDPFGRVEGEVEVPHDLAGLGGHSVLS